MTYAEILKLVDRSRQCFSGRKKIKIYAAAKGSPWFERPTGELCDVRFVEDQGIVLLIRPLTKTNLQEKST